MPFHELTHNRSKSSIPAVYSFPLRRSRHATTCLERVRTRTLCPNKEAWSTVLMRQRKGLRRSSIGVALLKVEGRHGRQLLV